MNPHALLCRFPSPHQLRYRRRVTESLVELRASPDHELCQLAEQKPGILDELAVEQAKQIGVEIAELEKQAEQLASEIKKLTNGSPL